MSRCRSSRRNFPKLVQWRVILLAGLILAPGIAIPPFYRLLHAAPPDLVAERKLLLDVEINGRRIGLVAAFVQRGSMLFSEPSELRDIGLRMPDGALQFPGDGLIPLSALPGLSWRMDEATQTLRVSSDNAGLLPTLIGNAAADGNDLPVVSGTGAVVNYNGVFINAGGRSFTDVLLDARAFSAFGVASISMLAGSNTIRNGRSGALRLDSTYTFTDPDRLRRYRVGDVINGGLAWTRPVRIGGVQISTDFALRPDLVTFPVPSITGQVAVPSSVDVLVNGVRQFSQEVTAGPFEIRQLPIVTGAGAVSLQVRDALGQQVIQTLPFYTSRNLLAPGLSAFW